MSESSYPAFDPHEPDWRTLVGELQTQVDALSLGLEAVRVAVMRLAQLDLSSAAATADAWDVAPREEAWSLPAAPSELDEEALRAEVRRSVEAARAELHGSAYEPPASPAAPAENGGGEATREGLWAFMPQSPAMSIEEEGAAHEERGWERETAREEVRRAVEQARGEPGFGATTGAHDREDGSGVREGAWPSRAPEPDGYGLQPPEEDGAGVREGVWPSRAPDPGGYGLQPPDEDGAGVREGVWPSRAPERDAYALRSRTQDGEGVREGVWPAPARPGAWSDRTDWQAQPEDGAAWAAEQPPAGLTSSAPGGLEGGERTDAAREEVRRAVEQARAELAAQSHEGSDAEERPRYATDVGAPTEAGDPDAARDEVRRAVEQARAELAAGTLQADEGPELPRIGPRQPAASQPAEDPLGKWHMPSPHDDALGQPATIVIEDPDNRLDLACVYATLDNLDCAGHASLLNYAAHTVTVGLGLGMQPPSPDAIAGAIRAAFGRDCRVSFNGSRLSVQLAA